MEHEAEGGRQVGCHHAVAEQDQQNGEQCRHEDLVGTLDTARDATGDDNEIEQHEGAMPADQLDRVGQQPGKQRAEIFLGELPEATGGEHRVIEDPPGHYAIEGEDEQRPENADETDGLPPWRNPRLAGEQAHGVGRVFLAATAEHDLGHEQGQADADDAGQVHQHEGTAAVGAGHVGKLPDIPEADGRTGGHQNEGPAAGPMGASSRARTHEISCRCHPPTWTSDTKCSRF